MCRFTVTHHKICGHDTYFCSYVCAYAQCKGFSQETMRNPKDCHGPIKEKHVERVTLAVKCPECQKKEDQQQRRTPQVPQHKPASKRMFGFSRRGKSKIWGRVLRVDGMVERFVVDCGAWWIVYTTRSKFVNKPPLREMFNHSIAVRLVLREDLITIDGKLAVGKHTRSVSPFQRLYSLKLRVGVDTFPLLNNWRGQTKQRFRSMAQWKSHTL